MATQHLVGDKSATLGVIESTPSGSNNTLAAQNADIYMGDGNGGQGLEAELEQLLKVSFFPSLTKLTGILCSKMIY